MDENVLVVNFSEDSKAYEALAHLKSLAGDGQIDLREAAVVERAEDGRLHLRDESGNEDEGFATLTGGTVGLLIGILGGPVGILFGGAVGLLTGAIIDTDRDEETDSVLEHISRDIKTGHTALLADVDEDDPSAIDTFMTADGGQVGRFARADVEAEIAAADDAAREARATARKALQKERLEASRDKVQAKLRELRERLQRLVHH